MQLRLEDITVDTLDQVAAEWEEQRIHNLVRDSMIQLGSELRSARAQQSNLEARAKIRALKLFYQYGFEKREIADLLGIERREVTKWLKPRSQ